MKDRQLRHFEALKVLLFGVSGKNGLKRELLLVPLVPETPATWMLSFHAAQESAVASS